MPQINSRLRQKIDTEANWNKALNFIPLHGEIIIYQADENHPYERVKVGDGTTPVNELQFVGPFVFIQDSEPANAIDGSLWIDTSENQNGSLGSTSYNTLAGKKVFILGDSINAGNGWEGGFANLIFEDFPGAIVSNLSISGSTLCQEGIFYQLKTAYQSGITDMDYIIFDGGGNDLLSEKTLGTVDKEYYSAGGYGEEFDINTITGSFEHLATNIQKFYPNSKVIFFNLFKFHPSATNISYTSQCETWDKLKECCEKYGIYYVDLWKESNFTPNSQEQWNLFMYDWVHLNEAGYRRMWPLIRNAINTIG